MSTGTGTGTPNRDTYHQINLPTVHSDPTPLTAELVPGHSLVGDSDRNAAAKETFSKDASLIRCIFFVAGHSEMQNTFRVGAPVYPQIPTACNTIFFNYPGDVSAIKGKNATIFKFIRMLLETIRTRGGAITGASFLSVTESIRPAFISESPVSLNLPGDNIENLNLFGAGEVFKDEVTVLPQGPVMNVNPACFYMLHIPDAGEMRFHDLGTAVLSDSCTGMPGLVTLESDGTYLLREAAYKKKSGDPVYLSDVNGCVTATLGLYGYSPAQAVLVSTGCRCMGDGSVGRVKSADTSTYPVPPVPPVPPAHSKGGRRSAKKSKTKSRRARKSRKLTKPSAFRKMRTGSSFCRKLNKH